jgi:tetratricopeptide (TPR) repeat protein/tRNA A-37 threonylcarbamoyl transferase component Bud32
MTDAGPARNWASRLARLPADQRLQQLEQLRATDAVLAAQVSMLLDEVQRDTAADATSADLSGGAAAIQLGPYQLLEKLGSGGMGTVWLAQQAQPRRLVALKTIRPDLLNARLLERFEHEARFLAALDHPAIARIFESGSSSGADGDTPWLAMEYVDGLDLLTYASRAELDLAARLRLVIAICAGVQHAHTRGVMHRDLKPANVLVSAAGTPKILDFGIARAVNADGPAATRLTRIGEVIGTVEYMSPEQLGGDPAHIDARADVYALGVIAFELLTGKLPHALGGCSLIEAIQRIQHQPPQRLAQLRPDLRGDLDSVVMKALAGDPEQRYQSASAFADDLQAWLEHRPIRARPPSVIYLVRKWVRRNRWVAVAAGVALLSLIGATVFSLLAAERATQALGEAQSRTRELEAVNGFVASMLTAADPESGGDINQPLREVLERAELTLDRYAAQPRTAGQLAALLGRTWLGLGEHEHAGELLDRAITALQIGFGQSSVEVLETRVARAEAWGRQGELDRAAEQLKSLLEQAAEQTHLPASLQVEIATAYALVIQSRGDAAAAIELLRATEDRYAEQLTGDTIDRLAGLRYNLAFALLFAGDFKEAETRFRAVVAEETQRLGGGHPQTLYSIKGLGQALHRQGRLDEAVVYYQQVHDARQRIYGSSHPATLNSATQLAAAFNTLKRPAEAEPLLRQVIAGRETRGELNHPQMIAALNILATTTAQLEQTDEALALVRRALATEAHTGINQETLASRNILATLLQRNGQLQAAAAEFAALLEQMPDTIGKDHINYAVFTSNAAGCDLALGNKAAARSKLEEVLPMLQARFGEEHPRTIEARERLQQALTL